MEKFSGILKGEIKIKLTILFYTNYWVRAGLERVLSILLPELSDYYNILLVTNRSITKKAFDLPEEIVHLKIADDDKKALPQLMWQIAKDYDVKLFVGNCNLVEYIYDIYKVLNDNGIKTIALNHEYFFAPALELSQYDIMQARREVFPKLNATLWLTKASAFLGEKNYQNAIFLPNPNTYDGEFEIEKQSDDKIILCVGRFLDRNKRVDRALKVFRKVVESQPTAKLLLIGAYDLNVKIYPDGQSIYDVLQELRFPREDSVVWLGPKKYLDIYYNMASMIILTSENEGFPMVLNEAAVKKCPGIIFRIPGVDEIIIDKENGYVLEQDDIDGMAERIIYLFEFPQALEKKQMVAKEYANRFSKKLVVQYWKELIDTVINNTNMLNNLKRAYMREEISLLERAEHQYQNIILRVEEILQTEFGETPDSKETGNLNSIEGYMLKLQFQLDEIGKNIALLLERLPLNNIGKMIGIYGMGRHTENLLRQYQKLVGKITANLAFIGTLEETGSRKYKGFDVYNVKDLLESGIEEIIISSALYESDMYNNLIELYGDRFKIYTFYQKGKRKLF